MKTIYDMYPDVPEEHCIWWLSSEVKRAKEFCIIQEEIHDALLKLLENPNRVYSSLDCDCIKDVFTYVLMSIDNYREAMKSIKELERILNSGEYNDNSSNS